MSIRARKKQDTVSFEDLQQHFDLPLEAVAEKFDMCCALLKKVCRRLGIKRWPYRQVSCIQNQIKKLEAQALYYPNRSGTTRQIDELKAKLKLLYANPNKGSALVRENLARGMEAMTEDRMPNVVMVTEPNGSANSGGSGGLHLAASRKRTAPESAGSSEVMNAGSVLARMGTSRESGPSSGAAASSNSSEAPGGSSSQSQRDQGSAAEGQHRSSSNAGGRQGAGPYDGPRRSGDGPGSEAEVFTDMGPLPGAISFGGVLRGVPGTWVFVPMPPPAPRSEVGRTPAPQRLPYPPPPMMPPYAPYSRGMEGNPMADPRDVRSMYPYPPPPPGYYHGAPRSGPPGFPPHPPPDYMAGMYDTSGPNKRLRTN